MVEDAFYILLEQRGETGSGTASASDWYMKANSANWELGDGKIRWGKILSGKDRAQL